MKLNPFFLPSAPHESATSMPTVAGAKAPSGKAQLGFAILIAVIIVGSFTAVAAWNVVRAAEGTQFSSLAVAWDAAIPLVPAWSWIYVMFYPVLTVPYLLRACRDDFGIFVRVSAGYLLQLAVCLPLFVMPIRIWHPALTGSGMSHDLLAVIYGVDAGFNVFPSMHVSYVSYIACVGTRLGRRWLAVALWLFCALIMASTLFIKQHYIVDLPAGLALGVATYLLVFRTPYSPFQKRTGPVSQ